MKRMIGLLALAVLSAAATSTYAGQKSTQRVTVLINADQVSGQAHGSLGSACNSTDSIQFIGCQVVDTTTSNWLMCQAQDSKGTYRTCSTSSPAPAGFVTAVSAIRGDSYVTFSWDKNSVCTYLQVYNSSQYEPKSPAHHH